MKIPEDLDEFMTKYHNPHYNESKTILETHNFVNVNNLITYDYFCVNCKCSIYYIIWGDDELFWNPTSCNETVIKKLLE